VLAAERLDDVRSEVSILIASLAPRPAKGPVQVVCAAGRGQLDDLAAEMAAQALQAEGIATSTLAEGAAPAEGIAPWLCCLSVLEEGNTADGIRYLVRRLQRQLPEARVVVGLWQAQADSPLLAELRQDATGETIVTSLSELAALSRARPDGQG
jgi:hypothetical protein